MIKIINKILLISKREYIMKEAKCFIFLGMYTVTSLLFPMFVSLIIDKGINNQNLKSAFTYALGMLGVGVLSVCFQYMQQVSFYRLGKELVVNIKKKVYKRLLKSNLQYWEKNNVGDILTVLEDDVSVLETLLTSTISGGLVNISVVVGIGIFILITD